MKLTKEQIKNISPKLAANLKWAEYVDWFYGKRGFEDYSSIALGFEAGARPNGIRS